MTDIHAELHAVAAKPAIEVLANQTITDAALLPLLWGIEEEGVPAVVRRRSELDPLVLANEAAKESQLGVGVGASLDYVVVTQALLEVRRPYLAEKTTEPQVIRRMGSDAARLVRRVPLKEGKR